MGLEIERKFLVTSDTWRGMATGEYIRQGYLAYSPECAVRVRTKGTDAWVGIKGRTTGATRLEFEYAVPLAEAEEMLATLAVQPIITKTRYKIPLGGLVWEVDEFHSANKGLIIAEIELESEDQNFDRPKWVGEEVTGDPRYYNSNLAKHPFSQWSENKPD